MVRKKLMNPATCVSDMLDGIKAAYPGLYVNKEDRIVILNKKRGTKVGILSGGGSGHEPFAAGYLADNMITGAVCGLVFTSPPSSHILDAIVNLSTLNGGGVLLVFNNYTGDVLNFGLAMEQARLKGIEVERLIVADDCALLGQTHGEVTGRRGIVGTIMVFKILGGMSAAGMSLSDLVSAGEEIGRRLGTMGVCLRACTLPDGDKPLFTMEPHEVSIGLGIHGEPGISTVEFSSLEHMVSDILDKIFINKIIQSGDEACILVGDLGSCTQMENFVICNEVKNQIERRGIRLLRMYVGPMMTSLDMRGFQVSVLKMTGKKDWLQYIDQPTDALGWPGRLVSSITSEPIEFISVANDPVPQLEGLALTEEQAKIFKACLLSVCKALNEHKNHINELDTGSGDGDCGSTLSNFANATIEEIDSLPLRSAPNTFLRLSKIAETQMGGTSGALYSLLLQGAAKNATTWESAWEGAIDTLYLYTTARVSHRTMLDALVPAFETYSGNLSTSWQNALKLAVASAKEGSLKTRNMTPKAGRATYVDSSRLMNEDPGAFAVAVWLEAILRVLEKPRRASK